jgi:hypothetical protein
VVDVEHVDGAGLVVDPVTDAVLAPTGPPLPLKGLAQRRTHSARALRQRPEDELDARRSSRLGQVLGKAPRRALGHDDPEAHRQLRSLASGDEVSHRSLVKHLSRGDVRFGCPQAVLGVGVGE